MVAEEIGETGISRRAYGWLVGLIVLNHLVLDPILTVYRVHTPPGAYEVNPLWRGLIRTDPLLFLAVQVPVALVVAGGFAVVLGLVERAEPPWNRWSMEVLWWMSVFVLVWGVLITGHHVWFLSQRGF